jgi:hypothetical protein
VALLLVGNAVFHWEAMTHASQTVTTDAAQIAPSKKNGLNP